MQGRITVRFTIAGKGTVRKATMADSELDDDTVERCMLDAMEKARFPQPKGGGMTIVEYPLTFAPEG